jgi:hypothetical protein
MPRSESPSRHEFPEIVVFTGDLVGSSKLAPEALADAMRELERASYDVARVWSPADSRVTRFQDDRSRGSPDFPSDWEPRFSAFRGDGWQCLGPEPKHALRGALILRARLSALGRLFDTRISIGIGSGSLTERLDLNIATGPAFELSGRGLDGMEHTRRFAIAWEEPPEEAPLLRAIVALADEISRNWTPGQGKVFARLLLERQRPSQEALARALDITQQTVAGHLSGGGDWALNEALKAVEEWG